MFRTKITLPSRRNKIYERNIKYVEIGASEYFRPSKIIWIKDEHLLQYGDDLEFPIKNVDLYYVDENNLVLTKGNKNLFYVVVNAPYRGVSQIYKNSKDFFCSDNDEMYLFTEYKSRKGELGISAGALILTGKDKIKVEWSRKKKEEEQQEKGVVLIDIDGDIIEEEIIMPT